MITRINYIILLTLLLCQLHTNSNAQNIAWNELLQGIADIPDLVIKFEDGMDRLVTKEKHDQLIRKLSYLESDLEELKIEKGRFTKFLMDANSDKKDLGDKISGNINSFNKAVKQVKERLMSIRSDLNEEFRLEFNAVIYKIRSGLDKKVNSLNDISERLLDEQKFDLTKIKEESELLVKLVDEAITSLSRFKTKLIQNPPE